MKHDKCEKDGTTLGYSVVSLGRWGACG